MNLRNPVVLLPEFQELLDDYNLLRQKCSDDELVAALIVKTLILTNGDAQRALGLINQFRKNAKNDNDIWASVDHFFQSWNARNVVNQGLLASLIGGFFNDGYSLLKLFPYSRDNWVPRDDPGKPPSPVTWMQYKWGSGGSWAALYYSMNLAIGSPEWKDFLEWLDSNAASSPPPRGDIGIHPYGWGHLP